ncbi:hypothetical protein DI09_285p10 [Mitosporidium daphniae]|uniref:Uncharacterized protein n=1 Tax=Mitosporidium daphniae TaxID=1485682 RepID=A0A098VS04_9MICR|nr:hypothetical protein DI09_285p10 [Mitosporidium daphniae]|eukprot:XP_013238186.1 uncharacterized protein DI09_285p10 [Mitosporidium daphniae]
MEIQNLCVGKRAGPDAIQLVNRESKAMELREKLESIEKRKQSDDLIIQLASSSDELSNGMVLHHRSPSTQTFQLPAPECGEF